MATAKKAATAAEVNDETTTEEPVEDNAAIGDAPAPGDAPEPAPEPDPRPDPEPEPEPQPAPVARFRPPQGGKLHTGRVKEARSVRRHLFAEIPPGVEPETMLEPAYWAHYARELRPMDLIEAFCEDGTWEALFRVFRVDAAEVTLAPVSVTIHDEMQGQTVASEAFAVDYRGPVLRHVIVRKDTGAIIKDKLWPRSAAYAYLREHLSGMRS